MSALVQGSKRGSISPSALRGHAPLPVLHAKPCAKGPAAATAILHTAVVAAHVVARPVTALRFQVRLDHSQVQGLHHRPPPTGLAAIHTGKLVAPQRTLQRMRRPWFKSVRGARGQWQVPVLPCPQLATPRAAVDAEACARRGGWQPVEQLLRRRRQHATQTSPVAGLDVREHMFQRNGCDAKFNISAEQPADAASFDQTLPSY